MSAPPPSTARSTARSPSSRSFCCGCTFRGWRCFSARWWRRLCRIGGSTSGWARLPPALAAELGLATTVIDEHIHPLAKAGFAAHTQDGRWVLAWSPESATLHDLYEALHLPLADRWTEQVSASWERQAAPAMDRIVKAESVAMQATIASLIAENDDAGKPFAEATRAARSDRPVHA